MSSPNRSRWARQVLGPSLVSLLFACQAEGINPERVETGETGEEVGQHMLCDLDYDPIEVAWDAPTPLTTLPPTEVLSELSGTRLGVSNRLDEAAAHAWVTDARQFQVSLAPHPTRPPIWVDAVGLCPEMLILPVAATVVTSGATLAVVDSGLSDAASWGADPGRQDLPWRVGMSSVVRIFRDTVDVHISAEPDPIVGATSSPALQADLDVAANTFDVPGFQPTAHVSFGGVWQGAGIGAVYQGSEGFKVGIGYAGGIAHQVTRVPPDTPIPVCAPSKPLGAGHPSYDAAMDWALSRPLSTVDLSWTHGEAPPEDWSVWRWSLDPRVLAFRVYEAMPDSTCVARDIALLKGTFGPVEGTLDFDVELELTLDQGEVIGLIGEARSSVLPANPAREDWWRELSRRADRERFGVIPPMMSWLIRGDEIQGIVNSGYGWHTPVVFAVGTFAPSAN